MLLTWGTGRLKAKGGVSWGARARQGQAQGSFHRGGQAAPAGIIPKHCSLNPFLAGEAIGARLNSDDESPYPIA
jgi:hypothetical protein